MATQRLELKICTRVVKILSDTAARRDSSVWIFKFIRRTERFSARGEFLNFESELSRGDRRRSFKIRSAAIEFKFYFGGGTLICVASRGGRCGL